jgi:hypothetical protein
MTNDTAIAQSLPKDIQSPRNLWWRRFFIRLRSWEYWPVYIFNIPVLFIWLWNAIRARNLFYFTLTNPGIETGGFFGESKSNILNYIPDDFKPITFLLKAPVEENNLEELFRLSGLKFPIIAKPEVGERGWLISRINNLEELRTYVRAHPIDTILQTYVDLPLEVSIMVYAMPDGSKAEVTSVCEKHFLQIRGDGESNIGDLILKQDRAVLHLEKLINNFGNRWNEILPPGKVLILESVGNHCRGTMFLDQNKQIDAALSRIMIRLLGTMPDVFYGRFDMRVCSWEELREGKNIKVLEFNGASSDPAHIYQPGYSIFKAYQDMAYHWKVMRKIALQNRERGYPSVRFKKIISALILYFRYKRTN